MKIDFNFGFILILLVVILIILSIFSRAILDNFQFVFGFLFGIGLVSLSKGIIYDTKTMKWREYG